MDTVSEAARDGAPEQSDRERARAVVESVRRRVEAALALVDRAMGDLMDVRATRGAFDSLARAAAVLMVEEGRLRRLLERGPRLRAGALAGVR